MKLNHTNIYDHVKQGLPVYYASFTGVMVGIPVIDINRKTAEQSFWLIIGTSMAIPINEHPNNNTQLSQPGYFSTGEEAEAYHRLLLVDFIKKSNASTLKNNPIIIDRKEALQAFAKWVDFNDYFDNGNTVVGALETYLEEK